MRKSEQCQLMLKGARCSLVWGGDIKEGCVGEGAFELILEGWLDFFSWQY